MKIKKISLTNFKHFEDQEIEFQEGLNALIGENNAGKTSIIHAIAAVFNIPFGGNIEFDFPSKLKNPSFTTRIEIDVLLSREEWKTLIRLREIDVDLSIRLDDRVWDKILSYIEENNLSLKFRLDIEVVNEKQRQSRRGNIPPREIVFFQRIDSEIIPAIVGSGDIENQNLAYKIRVNFNSIILNIMNNPQIFPFKPLIIYPYLSEFQRNENYMPYNQLQSNLKGNYKNINIRAQLFHLKRKDLNGFQGFKERLESYFPGIENVDVELDHDNGNIKLTLDSFNRDITLYGGGTQTFAQIFSIMSLREVSVILIDEPDAHLHASLADKFMDYIGELSKSKQIIITTHLPSLIDQIPLNDIISFELKGGTTEAKKIPDEPHLIDMMEYMGLFPTHYQRDLLLRADIVILVEGPTDAKFIDKFINKMKEIIPSKFKFPKIQYFPFGKKYSGELNKIIDLLLKFLKDKRIIYIRDRDEDSPEEIEKIEEIEDIIIHIWNHRHIESYLLDNDALLSIIKSKTEEFTDEDLKNKLENIIKNECENQYSKLICDYCDNRFRVKLGNGKAYVEVNHSESIDDKNRKIHDGIISKRAITHFPGDTKDAMKKWIEEFDDKWKKTQIFMINAKKLFSKIRQEFNISFQNLDVIDYMSEIPQEIKDTIEIDILNLKEK